MANEPERDIEKLLRASAKLRRDAAGEPRPMPPATRNLLQSEVARVHGDQKATDAEDAKEDDGFWTRLLWGPRMKLAWSVVIVGMVAFAGWFLLPKQEKRAAFEMAKNESEVQLSIRDKVPAISDDAARAQNEPARLTDKAKPEGASKKDLPGKSSLASRQPDPATLARADRRSAFDLEEKKETIKSSNQALAAAPPAATPPPPAAPADSFKEKLDLAAPAISAGERLTEADANSVSQSFTRVEMMGLALKTANGIQNQGVLASFRLEETNGQVRITDGDGSVYAGTNFSPAQKTGEQNMYGRELSKSSPSESALGGAAKPTNGSFRARLAAPQSSARAIPTRSFRVIGTNLTLHQQVIFSGRIISDAPAVVTNTPALDQVQTAAGLVAPLPQQIRIEGEVVIGNTNQIQITARPAGN